MAVLTLEQGRSCLERRARRVDLVIKLFIAICVLNVLADLAQLLGFADLDVEPLDGPAWFVAIAILAFSLVMIVAIILVSMWIYRAHANLRDADIEGRDYSPGWAVGWFFIPIASLFKPFDAMRDLVALSGDIDGQVRDHLKPWWAAWIIGNILMNISLRYGAASSSAEPVMLVVDMFATAAFAFAAWFLARIVRGVTQLQGSMLGMAEVFA